MDLAAELVQAILANRERINRSALAHGASGFVELHVNQRTGHVDLKLVVSERGEPHRLGNAA